MGVGRWKFQVSTPTLTLPLERGCCRFSGFTTTAYSLRVQGGGNFNYTATGYDPSTFTNAATWFSSVSAAATFVSSL